MLSSVLLGGHSAIQVARSPKKLTQNSLCPALREGWERRAQDIGTATGVRWGCHTCSKSDHWTSSQSHTWNLVVNKSQAHTDWKNQNPHLFFIFVYFLGFVLIITFLPSSSSLQTYPRTCLGSPPNSWPLFLSVVIACRYACMSAFWPDLLHVQETCMHHMASSGEWWFVFFQMELSALAAHLNHLESLLLSFLDFFFSPNFIF